MQRRERPRAKWGRECWPQGGARAEPGAAPEARMTAALEVAATGWSLALRDGAGGCERDHAGMR